MNSELNIKLYHERQRLQLCLLHTINNLLQEEAYKQNDLDEICEKYFLRNTLFKNLALTIVNGLMIIDPGWVLAIMTQTF